MIPQKTLVLGTGNRKKGLEMAELFASLEFEIKTLADYPETLEVVEDGGSFCENAYKKACEQAVFLNQPVLAEDSGLVVDALNGTPGVFSARFSGKNATDESNNALLLEKLADVPWQYRTAHYVCEMVLSDAEGRILACTSGTCRGRIRFEPDGTNGFGYDPLFEVVEYHRTFGQLDPILKQAISHRSRAARLMRQILGG
ncbi:MAG: non-canonical purine NTP pyrophosphatase [Planctomycetaceae bacterium]|nr:non-canonical purine NTP pyrophosphatase [Planctomycetaceae bacterium]